MSEKALLRFWFCLLAVFFLVPSGLALSFEPAECLVSRIYDLIRLPENKDGLSCWQECFAEPKCHMAVVTRPLSGSEQCLLVNCLNQGQYSHPRDPSARIAVYRKIPSDDEQRKALKTGFGYASAEETLRCHGDMTSYSSCRSGIPGFFYNRTSYRCERFFTGCGSSRNTFYTQEGCEALCNEKYVCYRPMDHGERPPFRFSYYNPSDEDMSVHNFIFYNMSSGRCEGFYFRGSASNGNIFRSVEECQSLCGGVKASASTVPAKNTASADTVPTKNTASADTVPTKNTASADTGVPAPVTTTASADTASADTASADTAPTTSQAAVDSGVPAPVTTTVILSYGFLVIFVLLALAVITTVRYCRRRQLPSSISEQLLSDEDE